MFNNISLKLAQEGGVADDDEIKCGNLADVGPKEGYPLFSSPRKRRWLAGKKQPWMKMYFLLNVVIFQCHANFPGCIAPVFGSEFIQHQHRWQSEAAKLNRFLAVQIVEGVNQRYMPQPLFEAYTRMGTRFKNPACVIEVT